MSQSEKIVVKIKDVMRSNYLEMDGLKTVKEALIEMKKNNASYVIIQKRHEHDEYGVVMLSDIAKKVLAKDKSPDRVFIAAVKRLLAVLLENWGILTAKSTLITANVTMSSMSVSPVFFIVIFIVQSLICCS